MAQGQNPYMPYAGRANAYAPPGNFPSQGWEGVNYANMTGLPRPMQVFTSGDFSPLSPIGPVPIDIPEEPNGRPRPRRWQMPVGFNLPVGQPGTEGIKLATLQQLRDLAEIPSIARTCIEIRKSDLIVSGNAGEEAGWDIVPTNSAQAAMQGNPKKRANFEKRKEEMVQFFTNPDPDNYDGFETWANALLEDILVLDAGALHIQPAGGKGNGPLGSDVGALALIDGSSIKPLVDEWGSRPKQPAVAYQQYMWSVPRVDLMDIINLGPDATIDDYKQLNPLMDSIMEEGDQWVGSEMIYFKQNPRTWTPYGFGPVEQGILPISILQARQMWQWEFFRSGSLPSVFLDPGESIATPEEGRMLMQAINQLGGDLANMHQVIVIPPGGKVTEQKPVELGSDFDTWVTSLVTMPFGLAISDLGIVPKIASMMSPAEGRMAAQQASDRTTRRSALPLARKLAAGIFNRLIHGKFGQQDMRWSWGILDQGDSMTDRVTNATTLLKDSVTSIDETRIALDLDPIGEDWSKVPLQFLSTGVIPMGQTAPVPGAPALPVGTAIDAASKPTPPKLPPGAPAKPPPNKPAPKPAEAPDPDKTVADQAAAQVTDEDSAPHTSSTSKEKALELRQLRRYLRSGRDIERFKAKALRPSAIRAARGEPDANRAVLRAAKAQAATDQRENVLAPVRASAGADIQALVVELVSGVIDVAEFVALAKKALSTHYQTAYLAGQGVAAQSLGSSAQPMPPALVLDKANARADNVSPYLKDLANDAMALGTPSAPATYAQVQARSAGYGNSVTAAYEEGQVTSYPGATTSPTSIDDEDAPQATADGTPTGIRWVLGDAEHCDNCLELDGQIFTEETLPGYPGDGGFGQDTLCSGGPNCACRVEFVSGDDVLDQSAQPSVARQSMAGNAPTWASGAPMTETVTSKTRARARGLSGARKTISLGSPLGSGFVPHDLSGPNGLHAPDYVGDDNAYRDLGIPHEYHGDTGVDKCSLCGYGAKAAIHGKAEKADDSDGAGASAVDSSQPAILFAGLVLRAADTGRWLGLQRAITEGDPAAGKWEMPGGHMEPGESPEQAAVREWQEEVGTFLPDDATWVASWISGAYQGFVVETAHEADVNINMGPAREVSNPDGDLFEACAWHSLTDLATLPVREEIKRSLFQVTHALQTPTGAASGATVMSKSLKRADATQHVYEYLAKNYEKDDLDWVDGCKWQLQPAVKLADVEWAHRPGGRDDERVQEKVKEIQDGKQPKPVVLVSGGGPKLVVADGYYRTEALSKAGHTTTAAWVGTPDPTDTDWPQKVRQMQYNVENHDVPREDARDGKAEKRFVTLADARHAAAGWSMNGPKLKAGDGGEAGTDALRQWYEDGADGQINWGSPGDFDACVAIAGQYIDNPEGYCQNRHIGATGEPAGHAPGEDDK